MKKNVRSVCHLQLNWGWVMQQDSDPKQRSKKRLQQKKMCLLEWPRQSPDLNPSEKLWRDLKRAIHIRHHKNIAELKGAKSLLTVVWVWSTITGHICWRLLLPKQGQTDIKFEGSHTFSTCTFNIYTVFNKDLIYTKVFKYFFCNCMYFIFEYISFLCAQAAVIHDVVLHVL